MDISPFGIVRNTFTTIPKIINTAFWATLGASPNADQQDALTEVICVSARPMLGTPAPLLASQKMFKKDWGVWGHMWVSKIAVSKFEDEPALLDKNTCGVREAMVKAILEFGNDSDAYEMPEVVEVEAEWTGYRRKAWPISWRPNISEREHYDKMMEEVSPGAPTILYMHGGAFCLMDPATHRWTTSALAQYTRGRCLSIRQRLSPQATFPAALLDAFISYLYLLSPPPGCYHAPVPASEIVLAGDSSGAGLAASLHLLLVTLLRIGINRVRFHDRIVGIPSPPVAGLALTSPWLDVARSLPSVTRNSRFDIIAAPRPGHMTPNFPHDSIWPASPPRVETYCEANIVSNPLVSPLAARPEHWRGAPPVYINVGWEGMQDEAEVTARRMAEAGVTVVFEGFVGMPHCFGMIPWSTLGWRALAGWAAFCKDVVAESGKDIKASATWFDKNGGVREIPLTRLGMHDKHVVGEEGRMDLDDETVNILMRKSKEWRVSDEREMRMARG